MELAYTLHCHLEELALQRTELDSLMREKLKQIIYLMDQEPNSEELEILRERYAALQSVTCDEHDEGIRELEDEWPNLREEWLSSYHSTNNPLFLWRIYNAARLVRAQIPAIVYEYFDSCAYELLSHAADIPLSEVIRKNGARNVCPEIICQTALGLKKKSKVNAFVAMKKHAANILLVKDIERIEQKNLAEGMKPKDARTNAIKDVHILQEKYINKRKKDGAISFSAIRSMYIKRLKNKEIV